MHYFALFCLLISATAYAQFLHLSNTQYQQVLLPTFAYTWIEQSHQVQHYFPLVDTPTEDICLFSTQWLLERQSNCTHTFSNVSSLQTQQMVTIFNACFWCSNVSDSSTFQSQVSISPLNTTINLFETDSCGEQGISFAFFDSNSGHIGKACFCEELSAFASQCSITPLTLNTWTHVTGKIITLVISSLLTLFVIFGFIVPYFGSAIFRYQSMKQFCYHLLFKWKIWAYVFLLTSAVLLLLDASAIATMTNYVYTVSGPAIHGKMIFYAAFSVLHCFSCVIIILFDNMTRMSEIKERKYVRALLFVVEIVATAVLLVYTLLDMVSIVYTIVVDAVIVTPIQRNIYYAILFLIYSILTIIYSVVTFGIGIVLVIVVKKVPFENKAKWTRRNMLFGIFLSACFAWIVLLMGIFMLLHTMQWFGFLLGNYNLVSLIILYGAVECALLVGCIALLNTTELKETYGYFYKASCIQNCIAKRTKEIKS